MAAAKILVVEDTPLNMELVTDLLEINGYEVLQAGEAQTGIDLAIGAQPDLILMDIQLPGMDGLTAIRILKADSRTSAIPVVALTAHAMTGDQEKAELAGCNGYLVKPVDTREFPKQVASFLNSLKPA
ncbi:MAG TPA: response regulator [Syntrophales bacterium]|nr:response regulator [Syntrophales bacterium]